MRRTPIRFAIFRRIITSSPRRWRWRKAAPMLNLRPSNSPSCSARAAIPVGCFRELETPPPMNWLTWLFVAALAVQTAIRLYLASRQVAAVRAHRDRVPEAFAGHIALNDQQKAADYTVARVRFGRWATLAELLIKLALTVGGGLSAVDAMVSRGNWREPWHGCLVILAVFLLTQVLGLPFSLWRTFGIEARFGFNRISPRLFAADLAKRTLLGLVLAAPLVLVTLWLMDRAGVWWWAWAWLMVIGTMLIITW